MKKCSLCGEKALEGIEICPECLKKGSSCPGTDKTITADKQHIKHNGRYRHKYKSLYAEHNRDSGRFGKGKL